MKGCSTCSNSAQRLSASSEFSLNKRRALLCQSFIVLNAFRHHRNSHRCGRESRESFWSWCSTPFGIIGILTVKVAVHREVVHQCSTPFGIIGILTSLPRPTTYINQRAQRLSASSEFSLRRFELHCLPHVTSLFSCISLFCLKHPLLNPKCPCFSCDNRQRIRHLTSTQVSEQLSYRAYPYSCIWFRLDSQASGPSTKSHACGRLSEVKGS